MRIHLRDVGQAKKLAKRLKAISENSISEKFQKHSLAECQHMVALMLGYRNWQELDTETKKGRAPSPDDRDVPLEEMQRRRAYQAERLVEYGIEARMATAIVDSLLPSGNPRKEIDAIFSRPIKPVDEVSGPFLEAIGIYLNETSYRVALGDIIEDHGLTRDERGIGKAHGILTDRMWLGFDPRDMRTSDTHPESIGYMGVVMPNRQYFQGYLIPDVPQVERDKVIRDAKKVLGLMGQSENEHALVGALMASICEFCIREDTYAHFKIGTTAAALSDVLECRYFLVISKAQTSIETWNDLEKWEDVASTQDARRKMMEHPMIKEIKDNITGSAN